MFQTDSRLCDKRGGRTSVCDYYGYDYIGAPWGWYPLRGRVGNGGLSLRRREAMLLAIERHGPRNRNDNEDVYFADARAGLSIAPYELAREFSVENIHHPDPFAVHQNHQCPGTKDSTHFY